MATSAARAWLEWVELKRDLFCLLLYLLFTSMHAYQRQPENHTPIGASAARRHLWQTSHILFNNHLATSRRRSIPFSGYHYSPHLQSQKSSLKTISPFSVCLFWLIHHKRLKLPPIPLRPVERSILFSETSVRLFDDAQSAASSHAPKKGCGLREVWRSQTCTSGSPFFCQNLYSLSARADFVWGCTR